MTSTALGQKPAPKTFFLSHLKYEHLIAGISGGTSATLILHPFDLLKIRFAVNEGSAVGRSSLRPQYNGLVNAVSTIFKQEGFRGFYRGVTPNCVGAGSSWGLYFFFYNALKSRMSEGDTTKALGPGQHMLAAAEAGAMTMTVVNPVWVVKTRLCLQYSSVGSSLPAERRYKGMFDALLKIYKFEGIRGLYKGYIPGLIGTSHGALQFMVYEEMKKARANYYTRSPNSKLGTLEYLSFAAVSKIFAASVTYPYQVVRARLQDQHRQYKGLMDVTVQTFKYEGLRGFYKGLVPCLLKVTPLTAVTFVVYENVSSFLLTRSN